MKAVCVGLTLPLFGCTSLFARSVFITTLVMVLAGLALAAKGVPA